MNVIDLYLKNISAANLSEQTLRSYRKDVNKLSAFFGNISEPKDFENLKREDFMNFFTSLNLKPSSVNAAIRNIDAFFSWMKSNGYISDSPVFTLKFGANHFLKEPKVKRVVLTDDEAMKLIDAGWNAQERFMLALMLYTAIRRQEVCNIKLSDISGCTILINGKGDKERKIFLNDELCGMLSKYLNERETNSVFLFYGIKLHADKKESEEGLTTGGVYARVKSAAKRAGIDEEKVAKISPHRLRGTSVTRIIRQFGIHAAMGHAGHANVSTTSRYDSTGEEIVENTMKNQSSFSKSNS